MNKFTNRKLKEQTTMGAPSVGAGGHIDLALGTYDRPGPNPVKDAMDAIVPKEMVATQLATARPPVEDEDYVPSSIAELAKAAAEIAKLIPPEQVKKFYLRLKELADESVERHETTTLDEKNMQELKKLKIIKMINEAMDDLEGIPSQSRFGREVATYEDIIAASPEEFEGVKPGRQYDAARKADMRGQSKLYALLDEIPESEIDRLMNTAKDEYIDLFEELLGDEVEPEDIADLKSLSAQSLYETSDSFKFFYKAAFILPATEEFGKNIRKTDREIVSDLDSKLRSMKVPASVISTAINQLMGATTRDPSSIKKGYAEASSTGQIKPTEVEMQYKNFMMKFPSLESEAKKKRDEGRREAARIFMKNSLDSYSKIPLDQRKALLLQAFEKMG